MLDPFLQSISELMFFAPVNRKETINSHKISALIKVLFLQIRLYTNPPKHYKLLIPPFFYFMYLNSCIILQTINVNVFSSLKIFSF